MSEWKPPADAEEASGWTPPSDAVATTEPPGKPPASPVTASPSTSVVGSGVGTPSGAGQTRLPSASEDRAAFNFNSAAMLGEDAPVDTPEAIAAAVNAKRFQQIAQPARKKAPYVPVKQADPLTEAPVVIEQQYTPNYIAQKKEAGTWTDSDEFRFRETEARQSAEAIKQRRLAIAQKVQQQGVATPEDEQELAILDSDRKVAMDAYERAVKDFATSGKQAYMRSTEGAASDKLKGDAIDVVGEEVVKPAVNAMTSFAMNAIGGMARTLDTIGNLPAEAAGEERYYSPMAHFADFITEGLDYVGATEAPETKASIFDKDWNFSGQAALPQLVRTGVYMGGLMASGGLAGRGGLGIASYLTTEEDYYREAIRAGLKPNEAEQFSMSAAALTSGLEGINPQLYGSGTVKGSMAKQALKALKGGKPLKEALKDGTMFVLKEVGGENIQELSQSAGDMMARYATNQALGEDKLDPSMTAQDAAETVLLTTALSGLAAGVGRAADRPLHQQAIEWAVNNPEEMTMFVQHSVPQEQQKPILEELQRRIKVDRGLPDEMTGRQRQAVAEAVVQKEKIKEKQRESTIDDTVTAALGDTYGMQLQKLDEEIADAMGISLVDIAKKAESDRLIEAYDKAKLKSELTNTPMPEGSTRPKEITLEPVLQPTTEVVAPSAEEVPAIESAPAEVEPGFYRETSVSDAIDLIPTGRRITELGDIHLADSPDMALGQGNNKGVLLEFDQSGITVKENTSKPGLGIVEGGGREFISRGQRQSAFKNALRRITVNNNARADVVGREVLNRSLKELEAQGWVKEKTADGTTWTKPPATGVVNKSQTDSDNATTETPTLTHVPDGPSRLSDIDIAKNSEDAFAAVVAPKPRDKKQALRDLKAFLMETFGWKDVRIGIDGHGSFDFTVDGVDFKVPGGGATIGGSNTFLEADLVEIINAKHDAHEGESQPPVITEQSNAQTPTPTPVPESAITEPTTPSGEVLAAGVVEDAAIEQLRAHASSSKNERRIVTRVSDGATVIDVQGGKAEDGLSDSVEFTTDKDANAWLESGDIIDSHTHPDESSFSDGDWGTFAWSHVKEMRVVTQSGTVFTLKKTPKWDAIPWEERTPRKIRDRWNELSNRDLTTKSVSENIHDINEEMAEEFGIEFSSSISLPGVEPTTEPLTIFKGVKGKIGPNGERISAHEGVEGVFGSLDQSVSEKYKGDEPLKRFDIPSGTTVGTVEVDVKGKSVDEYRAEEVKAINASPAQVVKLITLDSGKGTKQEQYIIKDKGLIDSATDVVDVPPPTEPPVTPPTEKPEPTEPERLMRAQAKRIKNEDPELFKALNLDDNTVYYDRFPNVVSEAAAQELIGYLGNSKAEAHITDPRKKIPGAVRAQMYKALKKQYYKEKDYDAAKRLIDAFAPLTTEAGQFTQALYDKEDFAEGRAVMQAMEVVGRQFDKKEERDKQQPKVKKAIREVNKKVVEEVLSTVKVKSKITNASTPDQGPEPQNKPHFGTKNKLFTKERKDAAWKAMMSRTAGAIIQPEMVVIAGYYIEGGARSFAEVAEKVVKRGGKKLLPYLKGAYEKAAKELGVEPSTDAEIDEFIAKSNTDKVVARLNKAIEKKDKKAQAKAIAELQQVAKDTGLWGTYKQEAVDRLRRLGDQAIKEDVAENPPLADFTNGLLKNLTAQMREEAEAQGKEEPEPKKRRKDIEVIGDAFKNFEKYEDVWKQTQNEFKGRLRAAEARLAKAETPAAKEEASKAVEREEARLASLDAYFGELMPKPFSEAGLGRAVKEGMKDLDQKIDTIIRQHYTVYDSAKRSLQDKLVQEAGINETQAKELSDAVGKEFDRLATDRKKKVIEKYISKKSVKDKKVKGIEDDLITLTNTGAFSDDQFIERYGEMMGWPSLTKENIQEIERLADRIQTSPEGRPREEAIADLLGYQANLAGVSKWDLVQSIWYANMLSGFQTQEVNALANVAQVVSELFIGELRAATRVKGGKGRRAEMAALLNAVGYGLKRGANEAGSTIRTGYSPIRGKVEIPPTLERISFKGGKYNPGNYAKYVRRVMVAADVLFFEAARELRAEQLAMLQARSSDPSQSVRQAALDIMNKGDDAIRNAKDQAHEEYEKEAADIKAKGLTPDQEKKALKKAVADEKRRVFELVEKNRPANIKEDAAKFAARVTYNYKPEGTLGAAAEGINTFLRLAPPFRYIIPFVNIIANVANETLNYTPVGYLRALSEGSLLDATKKAAGMDPNSDHFTEEQKKQYRADLIAKASVGMALVAAAMVLSDPGDDDDPVMEITANGFGDWKKNRALEETKGWQQYSIKIGDKWISYQYTPVATVLSMIGHYRDAQKYRAERIDDDELANLSVAAWRSGSTFMDATMLGTLKDVLGAARGEEEGWRGQLAMSATRIAKGMVVPAFYTQAARAVEAANESPMKDVRENPLGYLSQDIPVVRDAQFNRLNWLGEPVIPEGGVLPRFVSVEKSEPAAELIGHYGWNPSIPSFKKVYDPEAEKDRVTTKQEQYDFMRIRGQYLKNEITTRFDELMGLEKAEFLEEMKLIQSDATYEAKSQLGLDQ